MPHRRTAVPHRDTLDAVAPAGGDLFDGLPASDPGGPGDSGGSPEHPGRPLPPGDDPTGFDLGWDHARHGAVPPLGELAAGGALAHGWHAARAVFGVRRGVPRREVRQWLVLRLQAWRERERFDAAVTPAWLAQLATTQCPVTRRPLGGAAADAPVLTRLHVDRGYEVGNLAWLSRQAAQWLVHAPGAPAARIAHAARVESGIEPAPPSLPGDAVWRAAVLVSLAAPLLPFAVAVRMPLRLLPPTGVGPLHPAQQLQWLLTRQFLVPGWSGPLRRIAAALPQHALRLEFNLLTGALAPRVLAAAGARGPALRHALEDAWADRCVNRRWQMLALQLGDEGLRALLSRCTAVA